MMLEKFIWDGFRKGSRSSFEELYDRFFNTLYLYAHHLNPISHDHIEDVVHDVFLELWEKRERLPDVVHLKAYLFKIVRRKMFSIRKQPVEHLEPENILSAEHSLIEKEEEEIKGFLIQSCLSKLTPRQKEILHLKYYENLSASEIMQVTGLSQQRVYNILSESLSSLKSVIRNNKIFFSISLSALLVYFVEKVLHSLPLVIFP